MSFDRGEFQQLVKDVIEHKVKTIFISNKDRLSRISFNMWKELFEYYNCNLIVLNEDKEKQKMKKKKYLKTSYL